VAGGLAFFVGRDRDRDGELGDAEIEVTEYECGNILTRDVEIGSPAEATALASIAVINGSLTITGAAVEDVAMPRLQHLFGQLAIRDTPRLQRFGAPELVDILGDFAVRDNAALAALELPALRSVAGRFELRNNATLVDLTGLSALTQVGSDLWIDANAALASISTPIRHVGGQLVVMHNPALAQLSWTLVDRVSGVEISSNGLTSLQLTVVSASLNPALGDVGIVDNDLLVSASLDVATIGSLYLAGNDALTDLTVNAERVEHDVVINPNAHLRHVTFAIPGDVVPAFEIHGSLQLWSPVETLTTNFPPMVIDGVCSISSTQLTSLGAIGSAGILEVGGNPQLLALSGITAGELRVVGNDTLRSISLAQSTVGFIEVLHNAQLEEISLGSAVRLRASLVVQDNPNLVRVTAPSLAQIEGQLAIIDNQRFTELSMDHLQHIDEPLVVSNSPALALLALPALIDAGGMLVASNAQLHHVAFGALAGVIPMNVFDNPVLPACEVDALFARVGGAHDQFGNDETAPCTP
jgi:hypothetical protein